MENGTFLGEDYFKRLLEEIREIRLSERHFYQKITDIYATSVDYKRSGSVSVIFTRKSPTSTPPASITKGAKQATFRHPWKNSG